MDFCYLIMAAAHEVLCILDLIWPLLFYNNPDSPSPKGISIALLRWNS